MDQYEIMPMTVNMAAAVAMTGISRTQLYLLMGAGKICGLKSGRRTLITVVSIKNYLEGLPSAEIRATRVAGHG